MSTPVRGTKRSAKTAKAVAPTARLTLKRIKTKEPPAEPAVRPDPLPEREYWDLSAWARAALTEALAKSPALSLVAPPHEPTGCSEDAIRVNGPGAYRVAESIATSKWRSWHFVRGALGVDAEKAVRAAAENAAFFGLGCGLRCIVVYVTAPVNIKTSSALEAALEAVSNLHGFTRILFVFSEFESWADGSRVVKLKALQRVLDRLRPLTKIKCIAVSNGGSFARVGINPLLMFGYERKNVLTLTVTPQQAEAAEAAKAASRALFDV